MKIFDFTKMCRGPLLTEQRVPHSISGMRSADNRPLGPGPHILKLFGPGTEVEIASRAYRDSIKDAAAYSPETYGVQAIVFCIGKFRAGTGPEVWSWVIRATDDWIETHEKLLIFGAAS